MPNPSRGARNRMLESPASAAYDESTFHFFLGVERARTERSNRDLRLLLVTLEPVPGQWAPVPAASAARLFEGLTASLRETDVIGWYEQDRAAGALLAARAGTPGFEKSDAVEKRVHDALRRRLSSELADSLRVRVGRVRSAATATDRKQAGGWAE